MLEALQIDLWLQPLAAALLAGLAAPWALRLGWHGAVRPDNEPWLGYWQKPVAMPPELSTDIATILAVALAAWLCSLTTGLWPAILLALFCALALAQATIDWHTRLLSDELSADIALLGVLWVLTGGGDMWQFLGAGILGGVALFLATIYSRWRGREMLGMGDVKLLPALGLWLPLPSLGIFLFSAGLLGIVINLYFRWAKRRAPLRPTDNSPTDSGSADNADNSAASPFGPALIGAAFIVLLLNFYQLI